MSHGKIVGIMVVLDHGNPKPCNNFSNHTGAKLETYQIISADGMAKKKNSLLRTSKSFMFVLNFFINVFYVSIVS